MAAISQKVHQPKKLKLFIKSWNQILSTKYVRNTTKQSKNVHHCINYMMESFLKAIKK